MPIREDTMREVKQHGTITGYAYGCRCAACTEAKKLRGRVDRAKLAQAQYEHGSQEGADAGCRCAKCFPKSVNGRRARNDKRNVEHGTQAGADAGCRCTDCVPLRKHGTYIMYASGCRCKECLVGYSAYRQEMKLGSRGVEWTAQHGTVEGYGLGCRCGRCRQANVLGVMQHGSERTVAAGCQCQDCTEFAAIPVTVVTGVTGMRAAWRSKAACQGCPPDWFDVDRPDLWTQGRAVCDSCPVKAKCAEAHVGDVGAFGMFGGVVLWAGREKVGA